MRRSARAACDAPVQPEIPHPSATPGQDGRRLYIRPCYSVVSSAQHRFGFRGYFALEAMSPNVKHEFVDGHVFARAGGTLEYSGYRRQLGHPSQGAAARAAVPGLQLRPARASAVDWAPARLRHLSGCKRRLRRSEEDPEGTTLVNPCFLVEVLSPSTESYDRLGPDDGPACAAAVEAVPHQVATDSLDLHPSSFTPSGAAPRGVAR